jgi:hypothetical protein
MRRDMRRRLAIPGVLLGGSLLAAGCLDSGKVSPTEPETPGKLLAAATSGVKTAKPAYLVPLEPGVVVDPILSTGDIVSAYQMSGIPDGLGAYKTGGTIQLFMNHELDRTFPAPLFNNGSDGRIYQMQVNKDDPTRATLTLLLSGGEGDDIYNPDNLGTSEHSLIIQEDRNSEFRDAGFSGGYGRVLLYDLDSGTLRPVARVNTPPPLRPGTWESSGVINAEKLLGKDWWLVDVQAHEVLAPQPGPTLAPNSAAGEDGQLLAIKIPNS